MMGFDTQEIPLREREVIDVVLMPASSQLEDVVVVAFGTQKKQDVIGAVTTINPTELKVPSSNLTTALAGRLAGIIAYQRSGEPDRKSVVAGKSVSVRLVFGGRRIIKKKKKP